MLPTGGQTALLNVYKVTIGGAYLCPVGKKLPFLLFSGMPVHSSGDMEQMFLQYSISLSLSKSIHFAFLRFLVEKAYWLNKFTWSIQDLCPASVKSRGFKFFTSSSLSNKLTLHISKISNKILRKKNVYASFTQNI